jgi:hypothetical protein
MAVTRALAQARSPDLSTLTWPELLNLRSTVVRARRCATSAAWRARRPRRALDVIRLLADLAELTSDTDREFPGAR